MEWCIPHFGSPELTARAIASIRQQTADPIYIGDDSGNAAPLRAEGVHIILGPKRGFAPNVNQLVKHAKGEWLVLLNNDAEIQAGWVEVVEAFLAKQPASIGLVATTVNRPDGSIDTIGDSFSWLLGRPLKRGFGRRNVAAAQRLPLLSVSGAVLVVRRSLWQKLGGLDEGLAQYYEDVDFGWRALASGATITECLAATTIHHETSSFTSEKKAYYSARNAVWLVRRHFPRERWLLHRTVFCWRLATVQREAISRGLHDGLAQDVPTAPSPHTAGDLIKTQLPGWRELWLWPRAYTARR